jgi:phosphoribosylaminoimidazole-succinocarboxamide synthase
MSTPVVLQTDLSGLTLARRGKVRDVYDLGETLLIVATDRISAFDYVLGSGIPDKGKVLTQLSAFWFERLADLTPHHLLSIDVKDFPAETEPHHEVLRGRSMWVRKTDPLPVECVARGYLSGSGLKDYNKTGAVCGISLPPGLVDSSRLPEPIFTPATKAESGHDENISEAQAAEILGAELTQELKDLTLRIYSEGVAHAATCGIIIADTKFEFGLAPRTPVGATAGDVEPELVLIDEVLTPDSSRFWPAGLYQEGRAQPSFDKQFVRDYLEQIKWNKQPPVPSLPDEVVAKTREKYLEAYKLLTGRDLEL